MQGRPPGGELDEHRNCRVRLRRRRREEPVRDLALHHDAPEADRRKTREALGDDRGARCCRAGWRRASSASVRGRRDRGGGRLPSATSPTRRRSSFARRGARARRPHPRRDRQPVPRPPAGARQAQRAGERPPHARRARRGARERTPASSSARIDPNATAAFGAPAAVSVAPKKSLGQHFLVDDNILGVIGGSPSSTRTTSCSRSARASASSRATSPSAVAHVHAVELDRRLEPHLASIGARANVSLHWGDALGSTSPRSTRPDEARREPAVQRRHAARRREPRRPAVVGLWCVMVQREVADRFFARRDEGVRRRLRARPARRRAHRPSTRSRARSSGRRRTSTRRSSRSGAIALPARFADVRSASSKARSRTGARRSPTRSRSPASPRASRRSRRSRRSAATPTVRAEELEPARVRRARREALA